MCPSVEKPYLVSQIALKLRHIPGLLNVVADKLSRLGQTWWSLHIYKVGHFYKVLPLLTNWEICPLMLAKTRILLILRYFPQRQTQGAQGYPLLEPLSGAIPADKSPFKAINKASLKQLTFKTVFLLALGSRKCRSQIHAWQNKNIRHQSGWSMVSLYP